MENQNSSLCLKIMKNKRVYWGKNEENTYKCGPHTNKFRKVLIFHPILQEYGIHTLVVYSLSLIFPPFFSILFSLQPNKRKLGGITFYYSSGFQTDPNYPFPFCKKDDKLPYQCAGNQWNRDNLKSPSICKIWASNKSSDDEHTHHKPFNNRIPIKTKLSCHWKLSDNSSIWQPNADISKDSLDL